jgi:BlaI family penicillinase repressor
MAKRQLPDAELEVMACLWQRGPATAREIRDALHAQRPMVQASVFTLLKRLEVKGLVAREKGPVGKAFVYRAIDKPASTQRHLLGSLVDRVFRGSGIALVASLLESRPPTESEIDDLEKLLAELRQRARETPSRNLNKGRKGKGS